MILASSGMRLCGAGASLCGVGFFQACLRSTLPCPTLRWASLQVLEDIFGMIIDVGFFYGVVAEVGLVMAIP